MDKDRAVTKCHATFTQVKKGQVIKFLLEVPSVENQPSVRFLSSWMLIRIVGDSESKYFQSLVRLVEEVGCCLTLNSMFEVVFN